MLFFDNDLNFKKEIKLGKDLSGSILKITKINDLVYAFGNFQTNYLAVLDNDFNIKTTFRRIPTVVPFKHVYPFFLYMAYWLDGGEIATTSWVYYSKDCEVDILNAKTGRKKLSLSWQSPISPNQADVTARKNMYGCHYILRAGSRYVVETIFAKDLNSRQLELIVFDDKGNLLTQMKTQYDLIRTHEKDASKIYFVDDNDNICYWEVEGNWPWK